MADTDAHLAPPAISVCIPVFNAGRYLASTIRSVLDQSTDDWELVIVDDASTDDSWEVVQRYVDDPRVRATHHDVNLGAAATWNEIVEEARGRYVKVLCSDDLLAPKALATHAELLDANPTAVLAGGRRDIIDPDGHVLIHARGLGRLRGLVSGVEARRAVVRAGTNPIGEPSVVMFRRDALRSVGGFDSRWQFMIDLDAYMRVLEHGDLIVTDETVASFRVSPTQWSATLRRTQRSEHLRFITEMADSSGLARYSRSVLVGRARATAMSVARSVVYWRLARRARP